MERTLKIYFTTDSHGYLAPVDYATGLRADTGIANCIANFKKDGNTLVLDGGDTIQGSPLTYFLHKEGPQQHSLPAQVMNCGGYQYFTLGNHDFNYGKTNLEQYLAESHAVCLCANVQGVAGVRRTAFVTLENGLKIGLTGVVTSFVNVWEQPENLRGITITDEVPAAEQALAELKAGGADVTICIYHGGFERDLDTGADLKDSGENRAWYFCEHIPFDVLLTGHQHIAMANRRFFDSYSCQTTDKARTYAEMDVTVGEKPADAAQYRNGAAAGYITAVSKLCPAGGVTDPAAARALADAERRTAAWLDVPVGHLDTPLLPRDHADMAVNGCLIANFFNQVQQEASGAQLSASSLGNEVKGFDSDVTIRDVVATYIYPNTLKTLAVNRAVLKAALENCAEYLDLDENGKPVVSERFLKPKVAHYNYDYISGIDVTMDLRRPLGDRITSIQYGGKELDGTETLTLCMNNYRTTGVGGFDVYATCPVVKDQPTEIVEMIMDYIEGHGNITVDKTKYLTVLY